MSQLGWFAQRRMHQGKLAQLSKRTERHKSCNENERIPRARPEVQASRRLTKGGNNAGNDWFIICCLKNHLAQWRHDHFHILTSVI